MFKGPKCIERWMAEESDSALPKWSTHASHFFNFWSLTITQNIRTERSS
jgi:hypothetical protein